MQSLAALALTGTEYIKNKHTNKLSSLYIRYRKSIEIKRIRKEKFVLIDWEDHLFVQGKILKIKSKNKKVN